MKQHQEELRVDTPGQGFHEVTSLVQTVVARSGIQDVYVAALPTVGPIFADGFESGDTSRWSAVAGAR